MTVRTPLDRVGAYAREVRAHLADLGPEQVDDLTDGLEADLAEALADSLLGPVGPVDPADPGDQLGADDIARHFGPADAYAAELRAAAGMAGAATLTGRTRPIGATRVRLRAARARVRAVAARREVATTLELLRPVWWGARGWAWYVVVVATVSAALIPDAGQPYLPGNLLAWAFLAALVMLSVWGGRRGTWSRRWARRAFLAASVVAAVALPIAVPAMRTSIEHGSQATASGAPVTAPDGVWIGGEPVVNLFAYDAEGNLLADVQLFDERGRPVTTARHGGEVWLDDLGEWWTLAPRRDVDGRQRWNVFPLSGSPGALWVWDDQGRQVLPDGVATRVPPAPFPLAPALDLPDAAEPDTGSDPDAAEPDTGPDPDAAEPDTGSDPESETEPIP